jgi:ubiquinone/menaquinone biosynthesis C-methylase UbiE
VRRQGRAPYHEGVGENLPYGDASFDLMTSNIVLFDIPYSRRVIMEMARVLRPGGQVLIANLTS